jgi:hypothetical protein
MLIMILELSSLISDVKKIEGVAISSPPLYHWQDQAELSMPAARKRICIIECCFGKQDVVVMLH